MGRRVLAVAVVVVLVAVGLWLGRALTGASGGRGTLVAAVAFVLAGAVMGVVRARRATRGDADDRSDRS